MFYPPFVKKTEYLHNFLILLFVVSCHCLFITSDCNLYKCILQILKESVHFSDENAQDEEIYCIYNLVVSVGEQITEPQNGLS